MSLPGCEEIAAIRRRLVSCEDQKSYDEARHLKELGNALFRKKQKSELQKALQCYSKALLFAPWPATNERAMMFTEQLVSYKTNLATVLDNTSPSVQDSSLLATCFGNRSAVLYELGRLEECLADIKQALAFGFPEMSEYKLYRRQAWCLAQKGQKREAQEALDKAMEMVRRSNPSQEQLQKEQRSLRNKLQEILKHAKTRVMNTGTQFEDLHGGQICSAYESEHVCIRSSPEKGRFLEATHDIKPGEVVILEEPFAAILNEDFTCTHCSHCFQESGTLIPCRWCASEGYCSSECRQMAWKTYHWVECPVANLWKKCDWMLQLCLRIVLSAKPTELTGVVVLVDCIITLTFIFTIVAVEQCDSSLTKPDRNSRDLHYSSICSLVAHEDEFSDISQKNLIEKMADIMTDCFGDIILQNLKNEESAEGRTEITQMVPSESAAAKEPTNLEERCLPGLTLTQLRDLFLRHLLQLRCNTHTISAVQEEGASGSESVQTMSEVQLGSAVYPTASLMNHSCHPNAIFRFTGNRVAVCATREIHAGEEINNCYGPQVGRAKRAERQAELKRRFYFDCHCSACEGATTELLYREVVMDAFACPSCQGALQELGENDHQCLKCKRVCTLGKEKRELKESRSMLETACVCDNTFNLPLLLECQKLQFKVLHAHNMELARTNDIIARAYATQGDFSSACCYGELSCQAVEAVHGRCSIELANEQQKLAQLYFHSHRYLEALESARQAHTTLAIYHSPHHPDCIELRGMIEMLSANI